MSNNHHNSTASEPNSLTSTLQTIKYLNSSHQLLLLIVSCQHNQALLNTFNMQFTATIVSAALSMVLAPTGAMAWAQAENGIWTANNVWYDHVGDRKFAILQASEHSARVPPTDNGW